jgi:hypothetical protein
MTHNIAATTFASERKENKNKQKKKINKSKK